MQTVSRCGVFTGLPNAKIKRHRWPVSDTGTDVYDYIHYLMPLCHTRWVLSVNCA